jgi:hypothetical protein
MPLSQIKANAISSSASSSNLNIDAGTFFVDSVNNRVGVNTTSPDQALHVKGPTGQVVIESTETNTNPSVKLRSAVNNRNWELFCFATNAGEFGIYDGVAQANRFVIDSSGRVMLPYQPAFRAGNTSPDNTLTFASNTKLTFMTFASLNRGGHYNTSTQRFNAPVTGVYYFDAHLWVDANASGSLSIRVNGGQPKGGNGDSVTSNFAATNLPQTHLYLSIVIDLNAGDYVELFTRNVGWTGYAGHSWWQGYLLG